MSAPASFWQRNRTVCLILGVALLLALALLALLLLLRGEDANPMVYAPF
ncbi:MAG: hypothetical protein JNM84_05765 [Planctomycetes bacterium]|nr:hypothetical protein [Planctomycetota bacterium]